MREPLISEAPFPRRGKAAKLLLILVALPFAGAIIGTALDVVHELANPDAPPGPYMPLVPLFGFALGAVVAILVLVGFGIARITRR